MQLELPLGVASVVPPAWMAEVVADVSPETSSLPLQDQDERSPRHGPCPGQLELPLDLLDDPAALEVWRAL